MSAPVESFSCCCTRIVHWNSSPRPAWLWPSVPGCEANTFYCSHNQAANWVRNTNQDFHRQVDSGNADFSWSPNQAANWIPSIQCISGLIQDMSTQPTPNKDLLKSLWEDDIVSKLNQIPIVGQDIRFWGSQPAGTCSLKAIYKFIDCQTMGSHLTWKRLC